MGNTDDKLPYFSYKEESAIVTGGNKLFLYLRNYIAYPQQFI
ncbi:MULTISPECIES: hypothetical protein [Sphingobacterium]|nr:hypothetical protein [Sphingobacterium sp. E70]